MRTRADAEHLQPFDGSLDLPKHPFKAYLRGHHAFKSPLLRVNSFGSGSLQIPRSSYRNRYPELLFERLKTDQYTLIAMANIRVHSIPKRKLRCTLAFSQDMELNSVFDSADQPRNCLAILETVSDD
jgi:hypothetical protein